MVETLSSKKEAKWEFVGFDTEDYFYIREQIKKNTTLAKERIAKIFKIQESDIQEINNVDVPYNFILKITEEVKEKIKEEINIQNKKEKLRRKEIAMEIKSIYLKIERPEIYEEEKIIHRKNIGGVGTYT